MKKISFAIISAVLIAALFTACNGAESGKVSDTQNDDPILTTLEEMMTDAATDIENMFTENVSDDVSDSFDSSVSDTNIITE